MCGKEDSKIRAEAAPSKVCSPPCEAADQHKASALRGCLGVRGRGGWGRQGWCCWLLGHLEMGASSQSASPGWNLSLTRQPTVWLPGTKPWSSAREHQLSPTCLSLQHKGLECEALSLCIQFIFSAKPQDPPHGTHTSGSWESLQSWPSRPSLTSLMKADSQSGFQSCSTTRQQQKPPTEVLQAPSGPPWCHGWPANPCHPHGGWGLWHHAPHPGLAS